VEYPEGAFAAGIFHDLGLLLIAVAFHASHGRIQRLLEAGYGSVAECEMEVLGVSHADLSADALALWNLPVDIQRAVRCHHEPWLRLSMGRNSDCQAPVSAPPESSLDNYRLSLVVQCADTYVSAAGESLADCEDTGLPPGLEPFEPLGLELASAGFMGSFKTELASLAGLLR